MKKGFTLVELIGVIIILGLISLITIPVVTKSISKYKVQLHDNAINSIIIAAKNWGAENIGLLPNDYSSSNEVCSSKINKKEYSKLYISVQELIDNGYIGKKDSDGKFIITDPATNKAFCNKAYITIVKDQNKGYIYSFETEEKKVLELDPTACNSYTSDIYSNKCA